MTVRSIALRISTALLGVILGLAVGELTLRIFRPQRTGPLQQQNDPRYFSIPVPNLRGRETLPGVFSWSFTHDAAGRRVTGAAGSKKATARVLLVGDSFTYGLGVSDNQTFAYLLQRHLTRSGFSVEVINAGNQGKGTDYALRFFELEGSQLRPDVTVLGFFANDFRDNGRRQVLYRVADDGTLLAREFREAQGRVRQIRRRAYLWVISWSHLANLARIAAIGIRQAGMDRLPDDPYVGYVTEESTKATGIFLHRFAKIVRDAGSDLLIFYFPSPDEVQIYRGAGKVAKSEATLRDLLRPAGIEPISLTPVLAGSPAPLGRLYYDEANVGRPSGHWTPEGHVLVEETIRHHVRARLEQRKLQGRE
jgi:lysophospholipase L1-like esterase